MTRHRVVVSGNVGISHATKRGDLAVGNQEAAEKPIIRVNKPIAVHIDKALDSYGLTIVQPGYLQGYLTRIRIAD